MEMRSLKLSLLAIVSAAMLAFAATPALASDVLTVDMWGGNWRDAVKNTIAKEFTRETGIEVRFVTGGTIERLTKAKLDKGHPLSDVTLTTSHIGYLYYTDGLFQKLDMSKIPNATELFPAAIRSPYTIGLYSYVYTPVFRTDLMPKGFTITSWRDLWEPSLKDTVGQSGVDPSYMFIAAAKLEGVPVTEWKQTIPLLEKLKPNIKAFYQSDATSQDLIRTGETPVQVMLSINAYNLISQHVPITVTVPKEGAVVNIDVVGIEAGTKHLDAAYKFVNVALSAKVQAELCDIFRAGPLNRNAKIDPDLAKMPGVFTTPEQWKTEAIDVPDEIRAKLFPVWKDWWTEHLMQ
ncbi:MAG: ABC transporter substrate-binding protein [Acetobacteraceae bacterium]